MDSSSSAMIFPRPSSNIGFFFFKGLLLLLLQQPVWGYHAGLLFHLKRVYPTWEPSAIVDVGANAGEWSRLARQTYAHSKLLLLEATPKHHDQLQQVCQELRQAQHRIAVLSGDSGTKVSFFQGKNTGNSMFREQSKFYEKETPVERTTLSLDDAVRESFLHDDPQSVVDYIKIDVQGAELMVLQGATQLLEKATFVQFESGLTEYNAGGACFYQVDEYLRNHGFYWYELADLIHTPDAFGTHGLGQFDALYVKPTSSRLPQEFQEIPKLSFCGQSSSSTTGASFSWLAGTETISGMATWYRGFGCGFLVAVALLLASRGGMTLLQSYGKKQKARNSALSK